MVDVTDRDLLSELLRPVRLTSADHNWWHVRSPWGFDCGAEPCCAVLYYAAQGACIISAEGKDPLPLGEGDLALLPTATAHRACDVPDRKPVPLREVLARRNQTAPGTIELGGDGDQCRLLCAWLHYDNGVASTLYKTLPWILALRRQQIEAEPLLREVFRLLAVQRKPVRPGSQLITLRAFEMAFVLALRPLLVGDLMDSVQLLPSLRHPGIREALVIIHTRYSEPWSVDGLARAVGMSRSAFTANFRRLVRQSPARHLTGRRMQEAARLLTETDTPQSALPAKVGYTSAVGFHVAFRNWFDITPGEYRATHMQAKRQLV